MCQSAEYARKRAIYSALRASTGPFTVTIVNGSLLTRHFGVTAMGLIQGKVFNSDDGTDLAGFRIYLDVDDNGRFTAGEPSVRTDTFGHYEFAVAPGTYRVRETLVAGYLPSGPTSFSTSVIAGGTTSKNFSLSLGA